MRQTLLSLLRDLDDIDDRTERLYQTNNVIATIIGNLADDLSMQERCYLWDAIGSSMNKHSYVIPDEIHTTITRKRR